MAEKLADRPAEKTEFARPLRHETEVVTRAAGSVAIDHFALARKGLDIARKSNPGGEEIYDRLLSTWSRLGNQLSGPEPAGVDSAGESRQK